MAQGDIYVEVDASVVNGGIMPMAIVSGNPEPVAGQEAFGVWLRWWYDDSTGEGGFTGQGWFWDDPDNHLKKNFSDEVDFKSYLISNKPQDLNNYLGDWGADSKASFFERNQSALGNGNCFSFQNM